MFVLACREAGLDCDLVIKRDSKEKFLRNGADPFTKGKWIALINESVHNLDDIGIGRY
jgi:hypothetical protein